MMLMGNNIITLNKLTSNVTAEKGIPSLGVTSFEGSQLDPQLDAFSP